jgi:hypothetical protein
VGLEVAGGKQLVTPDTALLALTGALHIYGGDFFNTPRSDWDPDTLQERPFDIERARKVVADANERRLAQCATVGCAEERQG